MALSCSASIVLSLSLAEKAVIIHATPSFRRRPESRHLKSPRVAGQHHKYGFVRYAELFDKLDSGLRRNDGIAFCKVAIAQTTQAGPRRSSRQSRWQRAWQDSSRR